MILRKDLPRLACTGILLGALSCGSFALAKDAQEYFTAGMEAMALQDWKGAQKQFQNAIEEKKDFADAYNKLGIALFNQGKNMEAVTQFRQAVFMNPRLTDAWYHLAMGYESLNSPRFDKRAVDCYTRALNVEPENDRDAVIQTHYRLGLLYKRLEEKEPENKQDYGQAIAELEKAVELNPDFAEAHNELGRIYDEKIKRYPEAIQQYDAAIKAHRDYAQAFTNRGVAYWHDQNWDNALRDCRKAVEIDPKFAGGHYNLGEVLFAKVEVFKSQDKVGVYHDEAEKAIDEYRMATQLGADDPKDIQLKYWLGLGKAYWGYHDYENAIKAYKQSFKIRKWNSQAVDALKAIEAEKNHFVEHIPKPTPVNN